VRVNVRAIRENANRVAPGWTGAVGPVGHAGYNRRFGIALARSTGDVFSVGEEIERAVGAQHPHLR
jgi:hypothetical protein